MKRVLSLILALIMTFGVVSTLALSASAAGDSLATATSIWFDKTYSGKITETNGKDVYTFTLPSSGRVNISLKAYIYETNYYLYDADGNEIWHSEYNYWSDTSEVFSANWNFDLTKGQYYFAIEQSYDDCTGNYNFKATFKSANESFTETQGGNNQNIREADNISFDEKIKGQIALNDEKDIYTFTLPSSGRVNISLKAYIYETNYYLYDADGNEIWHSEYNYRNETSEVFSTNWNFDLTKGQYYFAIEQSYDDCTGNYNFKTTFKSANESFSETQGGNNQDIKQADKISLNKTYKGQIALNDNKDIYKLTLSKSAKVTIKLTAYIYITNYHLYDANGNEVWRSTYQYWNETSKKYTLNQELTLDAGKYYFAVEECDGTGNYTFSINCSHNWKKTVDKKATTSADGKGTKVCGVCGKEATYTIPKIKSVTLSATKYTYNASVRTPYVKVKDSKGNALKEGTDYTVKYSSGRKNVGKYTVTVTFKGKYSGTKKLTFKINPKSTSISELKSGKKQFKVTWKKQSAQVSGYQIQYSTSSKMTNAKTKTVSGASKTSNTVSSLKSSTRYYVRIRTYKTVDGTKYYSSWSSIKNVKTK